VRSHETHNAYEITSYSRQSYCPPLFDIICAFNNTKISNEPNYKLCVTFDLQTAQHYVTFSIKHGSFLCGAEDVWTNCLVQGKSRFEMHVEGKMYVGLLGKV
jgi:hypothetical protein